MKPILLSLAIALAAPFLPATAFAQQPAAAENADAMALAQLVMPARQHIDGEIEAVRKGFFATVGGDADAQAVEEEFPGIYQAVWEAMEPELRRSAADEARKFWPMLAKLYAERLTPAEIATLHRFYSTPTGQKMIRMMTTQVDLAPMMSEAATDPDSKISKSTLEAAQSEARSALVESLGKEDEAALTALAKGVSMPKMMAVGREVQSLTLEWMNAPDPEMDARLEKIVEEAMERYIAQRQK